jgi:signal transduction histidine kinase
LQAGPAFEPDQPLAAKQSNQVKLDMMNREIIGRERKEAGHPQRTGPAWERWGQRIGDWFPYVTLAVSTVLGLIQPGQTWREFSRTAALAALAALWVYVLYTRASKEPGAQPARIILYYTGLLALAALLMSRQSIFFVFAITGLLHASQLKPWPLVFLGVGVTSILVNTIITGFPWRTAESWFIFGTIIIIQTLSIGFGTLLAERIAELSEGRRQAVARLEAALEENAGLQAQLVAGAREAGVLEERQRLAREIHDTLAQGLIGIITQLGAVQQAKDRPIDRQRHLDHAMRLARESLAEARRSVDALRPEPLEGARLPEALSEVAQVWSGLNGVPVEAMTTGDPLPLHPEVEEALLRTAQEALANIAKHARATRVGLTLSYIGDEVTLDIRDDGVGFSAADQTAGRGAGFGLTAMRQRVGRVSGMLSIESEPGKGAVISARVPALAALPEVPER